MLSVDFITLEYQFQRLRTLSSRLELLKEGLTDKRNYLENNGSGELLSRQLEAVDRELDRIDHDIAELAYQTKKLLRIIEIYNDVEKELVRMVDMLPEHIFSNIRNYVSIQNFSHNTPIMVCDVISEKLICENWLKTASILWRNRYE